MNSKLLIDHYSKSKEQQQQEGKNKKKIEFQFSLLYIVVGFSTDSFGNENEEKRNEMKRNEKYPINLLNPFFKKHKK